MQIHGIRLGAFVAALLFTTCLTAAAQVSGGVRQSGPVTPGDSAVWVTNNVIEDGGGAPGGGNVIISPATGNVVGDVVTMSNTTTGVHDSGVSLASITSAVKVLGQSGLPLIIVGSGSMGNNGAITLTTALVATYASTFIDLPANAIATGSAAGWYYATFSSGTAGTVFNNTYTPGGTPVIPASPTPFVTTGPGAYTGISGLQTLYSLVIPGNTFGISGGLRASISTTWTNAAGNKTLALNYGAMQMLSLSATTSAGFAGIFGIKNRGATGVQVATSQNGTPFQTAATAILTGTVDSTASQNFNVQINNSTPASNNALLESVTVEMIPGVL